MDPLLRRIVVRHVLGLDEEGQTRPFRIQLNGPVDDEIEKTGGWIMVDLRVRKYPRVQWWTRGGVDLHVFAHRFMRPGERLRPGLILHHDDEDKMNNTVENLFLVRKKIHDKFHRELRRVRKFGRREREHEDGFYRHRPPTNVSVSTDIAELRKKYDREGTKDFKKSESLGKTHGEMIKNLLKEARRALADRLPALRLQMIWLFKDGRLDIDDSLDPRWDSGKTWKLQLKKPRLHLNAAEEALILLYLRNDRDLDAVANETGIMRELLAKLHGSDAVAHALDQLSRRGWRFPPPNPSHPGEPGGRSPA